MELTREELTTAVAALAIKLVKADEEARVYSNNMKRMIDEKNAELKGYMDTLHNKCEELNRISATLYDYAQDVENYLDTHSDHSNKPALEKKLRDTASLFKKKFNPVPF